AFEHVVLHHAVFQEPVVHVGDLELSPSGGLEGGQNLPDRRVIKVNAGDGEVARWLFGLLDDPLDPAIAVELRDSQVAQMLAIGFLGKNDSSAARLLLKSVDTRADRPLEDVVPQQHDTPVTRDELLSQAKGFSDPTRLVL